MTTYTSIVVPLYNEVQVIDKFYPKLKGLFVAKNRNYELIGQVWSEMKTP